jgi:hypothetical protein
MRANIGGKVVETDPQNILSSVSLVNNVNGRDIYSVGSYYNRPLSGLYDITNFYLALYDPSQTALKNTNLTKTAPRLSDWQQSQTNPMPWGFYVAGKDLNTDYLFHLRAYVTQMQKV